MLSYSKGSRGLFVPSRVIGIFTDTTISLSSRLRQRPDHYTIQVSGCILHLSILHSPVFLLNSCLDLFSAPNSRWDPLSRSYRVNLPSSLTVNHSSALVYSTRLRVSVCGTGTSKGSTGILTCSAIGLAVRLSLRTRLTLIRLALIRKP